MDTQRSTGNPIRVVQITDTHLFGDEGGKLLGIDTYATLKEVLSLALAERGTPDFLLLTGDLSQDESAQSYLRLRELVATSGCPVYFLPGNHDAPLLLRENLGSPGSVVRGDDSFIWGEWQTVLLDTHVDGQVEGRLAASELERLDRVLGLHPEKHALVCLHHNPVSVNNRPEEKIDLENPYEFFSVLDRHRQVRAILWGHVHREFSGGRHDVMLLAAPSTCVQFKDQDGQIAVDNRAPGYRWLELNADGTVLTAVNRLPHVPQGLQLSAKGY